MKTITPKSTDLDTAYTSIEIENASTKKIKYSEAILKALDHSLETDPSTVLFGLGTPDPKGVFGTSVGLQEKYGEERVFDMPCAENGMTGIAIGMAINGLRPVLTHQRLDFAMLSLEQIVNQAAKWHYMFDGKMNVPLVIRMIIGRGWGQGPQHSQCLASWFAHIPGLKVVAPVFPQDACDMLAASVQDNNPVIFLEHRWLHFVQDYVSKKVQPTSIDKAKIVQVGKDITIVSYSYMVLEAMKAADHLREQGVSAEVIDLRSLRPLDTETILDSVQKTGRLLTVDCGLPVAGIASEITTLAAEALFPRLKTAPQRLCPPDMPTPTSPALALNYYPRSREIVEAVKKQLPNGKAIPTLEIPEDVPSDKPDPAFTGPF